MQFKRISNNLTKGKVLNLKMVVKLEMRILNHESK